MEDRFSGLSERYNALDGNLGQVVRRHLLSHQLEAHLPPPPARILDVGGGAGQQSIPLARNGHEVTVLDASPGMLEEARRRLADEHERVRRCVRLVEGAGEDLPGIFEAGAFDAALCHGVVMYMEDPRPMIRGLASAVRPGGLVSVLAKNAAALAMRPALKGQYQNALALLGADRAAGHLGVVTRGDTVEALSGMFDEERRSAARPCSARRKGSSATSAPPGTTSSTRTSRCPARGPSSKRRNVAGPWPSRTPSRTHSPGPARRNGRSLKERLDPETAALTGLLGSFRSHGS